MLNTDLLKQLSTTFPAGELFFETEILALFVDKVAERLGGWNLLYKKLILCLLYGFWSRHYLEIATKNFLWAYIHACKPALLSLALAQQQSR